MTEISRTVGAARFGDIERTAQVEYDGTRFRVTALEISRGGNGCPQLEGRLFFNVPERMAIIKAIHSRAGSLVEASDIVQFEMAQSLLDPPEKYYLDAIPLGETRAGRRYLSVAYPRQAVDQRIAAFQQQMRRPSGFKLNAVAMVDAYVKLCHPEPGELQLLADLEPNMATLAIVYQRKLRAIGLLDYPLGETVTADTARQLGVEFKLVASFHLNELLEDGISVPLSRIILSGSHAQNELIQAALSSQMATEIILPPFNPGYFHLDSSGQPPARPEEFLIPLGLAVE